MTKAPTEAALLLPGEMNILQIQCKIYFNTFLLRKPHSRCLKWLRTMSEVHVGWLLGIPGHHRWSLVLTGNVWVIMDNCLCFLYNCVTKWCFILCYSLLFVACSEILLTFLYETFINGCKCSTGISVKGQKSIFQRRKPSKWWPNMVMAKDASHTFNAASVVLMAPMDFFVCESYSPLWATVGRKLTILTPVWLVKMAIKVKNGQIRP